MPKRIHIIRYVITIATLSILTLGGRYAAAEPTWFKEKYAALIEIADSERGAEQIDALFGKDIIAGLDETILEGWRIMPMIDPKPIVEVRGERTLEIQHLILSPDALPAIRGMFKNSEYTANAVQAVLSRVCQLPGAYILGVRGYQFNYVFWTPTLQQYGPLSVKLSACKAQSPFAQ